MVPDCGLHIRIGDYNRYRVLLHKLGADIVPQFLLKVGLGSEVNIVCHDFREDLSIPFGVFEIIIRIGYVLRKEARNIFLLGFGILDQYLSVDGKE
jgi:hypothetical protein